MALALVLALALAATASTPPRQQNYLETFDAAWALIEQTHWDTDFNGVDWQAVRDELRPRAAAARSVHELRALINEMIGRLGQSHFALWPREARGSLGVGTDDEPEVTPGRGNPGLKTMLIGDEFVVSRVEQGGGAAVAGVQTGWIVRRIAGVAVGGAALQGVESVDPRRVRAAAQRAVDARLSGVPGAGITVVFADGTDAERALDIRLAEPQGQLSRFGNMPPLLATLEARVLQPDIDVAVGVIEFNIWLPVLARPFDEAIDSMRAADGVILDLRGNPGGVGGMVMGFGGHFVDQPVSLGSMRTRDSELRFVLNPRRVDTRGERVDPYAGPLAMLIDGGSGSTTEVFAGGLQAIGRARVFGQPSMGVVLPSLMDELPNGDILQHAFADFIVAETGVRLEGRGVLPDVEVEVTRGDLLQGRDPVLEAAVEWITRQR